MGLQEVSRRVAMCLARLSNYHITSPSTAMALWRYLVCTHGKDGRWRKEGKNGHSDESAEVGSVRKLTVMAAPHSQDWGFPWTEHQFCRREVGAEKSKSWSVC